MISGVLAILILVVNIGNAQIFTVITSIGIIMIYIAYLLVTVPTAAQASARRVAAHARRGPEVLHPRQAGPADQPPGRRLGHLHGDQPGLAAQGRLQRVAPFHWYLQYGAVLFIGIVFFGGLAYFWFVQRHKTGVLDSHRFQSESPAVAESSAVPESAP